MISPKNSSFKISVGIRNVTDFSPFGVELKGRNFEVVGGGNYRYSFQGQESDSEVKGEGNYINFSYRGYDPRIGRFSQIDPLAYKITWNSPYSFSENNVIHCVEFEGLEKIPFVLIFNITNSLQYSNFGTITNSSIVEKEWQRTVRDRQNNGEDLGLIARKRPSSVYPTGGIQLEVGKPSELLDDIISNPTGYTLDCAVFCQIATLSAFKEVLGNDEFDSRYRTTNSTITGEVRYDFFLMQHNSAGLKTTSLREFSNDVLSQEKGKKAAKKSRSGSRISLVADNPDIVLANEMDAYLTENIVHLGKGIYSGIGVGSNLTLDQVQQRLLETTGSTFSVQQVEQYKMGNKKTTRKNAEVHRN